MQKIINHFNQLAEQYDVETSWRQDKELLDIFIHGLPDLKGLILELGCGTGIISKKLKTKNIIGIDCSSEMCKRYSNNNLKSICSDVRDIPIIDNSTSFFLIRQLLQYFTPSEMEELLKEIDRLAISNDCVILSHHFVSPEDEFSKNILIKLKKHIQPLRKSVYTEREIESLFNSSKWVLDYNKVSYHIRKINIFEYFNKSDEFSQIREFTSWLISSMNDSRNKVIFSLTDNILTYEQKWSLQRFIKNE